MTFYCINYQFRAGNCINIYGFMNTNFILLHFIKKQQTTTGNKYFCKIFQEIERDHEKFVMQNASINVKKSQTVNFNVRFVFELNK